jgi:asparagine synthase (glutamine-hydrolysing)
LSGIAGIFHRDGAPVNRALLDALTRFLDYRGPDGREVWSEGPVGFGITLLRTTRESAGDHQPGILAGQFSILADARIDCRAELETKLRQAGRNLRQPVPDSELILHAYAVWGEECLHHLRGDFAFAIWDARRESLFCARDHFGIKPFYYAELGEKFIFSNTLNCLRLHPGVSGELSDAAIADFLLFGLNCDDATTTFRDVRRLPPAHLLRVSREGLQLARYWSPPVDGRIRYSHAHDYIEHFQVLLQSAVADRLRTERAGILLSGGLDSSSIAATARELSSNPAGAADLRAYTITYQSLIPDRTGAHARKVAEFLRIPIRCLAVDDLQLFERWNDPKFASPEPVDDPFFAGLHDQFRMISEECRVVLEGEGIDNLMHFQMWPHVRQLVRDRDWAQCLTDVSRYLVVRPFPWRSASQRLKALFQKGSGAPAIPRWFAPDFAKRVGLETRWEKWIDIQVAPAHPLLPKAHASLSLPHWSRLFELENPGVTRYQVEVRHPFLDLRIVDYVLALPPFPWIFEKSLLREAMSGHLPESIRLRRKTPLEGDPLVKKLQEKDGKWLDEVHWSEELKQFVDFTALPSVLGQRDSGRASADVRPICLNLWLQYGRQVGYNLHAEVRNG